MGIPANVYRVTASGSLSGGEIWSNSWWVQGAVPTDNDEANAAAQLWHDQCTTSEDPGPYLDLANQYWSPNSSIDKITIYAYPNGGPHATYIGEYSQKLPGAGGYPVLPNQICVCVSLRTGAAGRRARGRLYVPCDRAPLDPTGQFSQTFITRMANDWAGIFSDWNASGDNGKVVVVSPSATDARRVTQVIVDSRPDVQRRRAASQAITGRQQASVTS